MVGVFNNAAALDILKLSAAAMIEAPVRFSVTKNDDGAATLTWKTPSLVFAPYRNEGGEALVAIAVELDAKFDAIAARALL